MNNKFGTFTEPGTIYFERLLPGPIEQVWAYLTESEKRGKWLAPGKMELRIGGKVELHFHNAGLTPHNESPPEKYKHHEDGSMMKGKITKLDPPNLLSYTWGEEETGESEVTFELEEKGEKVLLKLTHRNLGKDPEILLSVGAGWHTHLGIMVDKLSDRQPKGFWSVHMKMEDEYRQILAAGKK